MKKYGFHENWSEAHQTYVLKVLVEKRLQLICYKKQITPSLVASVPLESSSCSPEVTFTTAPAVSKCPSGNFVGWKSTFIGYIYNAASIILKRNYKETINLSDGLILSIRAFLKSIYITKISADKHEMSTVCLRDYIAENHQLSESSCRDL